MRLGFLLMVAAALVVLYLVTRPQLATRPPLVGSAAGGGGSILDSLNAGASKVKTLFGTVFGGASTSPPPTSLNTAEYV